MAKGDSATTQHYWKQVDCGVLQYIQHIQGPSVQQPNYTCLKCNGFGQLPLSSSLSPTGKQAMILPALKSSNLISLRQLCDDNCKVVLSKQHLHAIKDDKVVLEGFRNSHDGLWDIPIRSSLQFKSSDHKISPFLLPDKSHKLQVIIKKHQPATELAQYLHAACFSPVISTWIKTINNNNFITWPGLTAELIKKHLPVSSSTVQGHLHRERENLQSTKPSKSSKHRLKHQDNSPVLLGSPTGSPIVGTSQSLPGSLSSIPLQDHLSKQPGQDSHLEDFFPLSPIPNTCTNQVIYLLIRDKDLHPAYQDLTGRFPIKSSRGNEYILVGYHYDGNYIHGIPVKNRSALVLTEA